MPVGYEVRVYDNTGGLLAVSDRFRNLTVEHRVNYASTLRISFYENDDIVQYFTLDALVEVRRVVPEAGLAWYAEYIGFHRTPQRQITSGDQRIFTSYGRGLLDLINRRTIRYYAETAGSAKGPAPADDVIKEYVDENAGPNATLVNGRVTAGVTTGLGIEANASAAANYEGAHAWDNLLEAIRKIGEANSVDFNVVDLGFAAFEFRTYYPQLGTDRRFGTANPQIFSTALGNMIEPSYTLSRTEEVSSALVLGPGETVFRDVTERTSSHTGDSSWNVIEQNINASQEDRADALNAVGDQLLYDKRPAVSFTFGTIQTPGSTYGQHYFLGDLVTGRFSTIEADVKIRAVTINVGEEGTEEIRLELEEIP